MHRKKAIVAAATVAGTLLAASSAYALTSGIVDSSADDGAGNLSPVLDGPSADASTGPGASTGSDVASTSAGREDDSGIEAEDDDHDLEQNGVAVDEHEYEGRDDDD